MNVGDWVKKWSLLLPHKTAIIDEGHEFSYGELNQRCNRVANFLLERGVKKGDRVGVLMYNCHEYIEIYLALGKIGAIFIPLNWRMAPREIAYILKDSGTAHLFFHEAFQDTAGSIKDSFEHMNNYVVLGQADILWAEGYEKIDE